MHFTPNLHTQVSRSVFPWETTIVRIIDQQPLAEEVHVQPEGIIDYFSERFHRVSLMLTEDGSDVLAFRSFPGTRWK